MTINNSILRSGFIAVNLLFLISFHSHAQSGHKPDLDFSVGSFISAEPDSIFKMQANAFIGAHIPITSIRLIISDTSFIFWDHNYTVLSLPFVETAGAWKDQQTIRIDVPPYNPFKRKFYTLEFIGASGQLIMQIEKEF